MNTNKSQVDRILGTAEIAGYPFSLLQLFIALLCNNHKLSSSQTLEQFILPFSIHPQIGKL